MIRKLRVALAAGLCLTAVLLCASAQTAYAAPQGVVADENPTEFGPPVLEAAVVGYDSATIRWNPVEQAAVYEVQQSEDKKNYTTIATVEPGQEMSYTASGLYTSKNYYFKVCVISETGDTAMSESLKIKTALAAPTITKLTPRGYDQIDMTWSAVDGAAFYRVYRSLTQTGGYQSVKTVYGTSYTNKVATGVTYYYKIMPFCYNPDGKKVRGKCSAPQHVAAKLGAPSITNVTNSENNTLTVHWNELPDVNGYAVFRSTEKSTGYQCVAKLTADMHSWTDLKVEAGTKYFYKVSAGKNVNGKTSYGSKSAAKSKWTKPVAPTDFFVTQDGSNGVILRWNASKSASSYRIFRSKGTDADAVQIASGVTSCDYTDVGLIEGQTYTYYLEAVHGSLVSDRSSSAAIKIGGIKVNTRTLFLGPGVTATVSATSDLPGTVTFSSQDPGIVTVSADGTVIGVAPGQTQIIAAVGAVATTINVSVTDAPINGIDVSKWQQYINWETVKASGIKFAMIRLAHGASKDIQFENYYNGAISQGIDVGVYCYTTATSIEEGIEEAENLLNLLGGKQLTYPVALDLEDDLQIKNMSKSERTDLILEYKRIIEEAGYQFIVYANLNWLNSYIDQTRLAEEGVDIWIARYRNQSLGHGYTGGGNVRIWQYSDKGNIDGIFDALGRYNMVDLDVCYEGY